MKIAHTALLIAFINSACNGQLDSIGRPPEITGSGAQAPVIEPPSAQRVSLAPPSVPEIETHRTGSLWQSGPKSLFGDRRARVVGDILTVNIEIADEAELSNTTSRNRSGSDDVIVGAAYGIPAIADSILPAGATLSPAVQAESSSSSSGDGQISREEEITLKLAATVVRVLQNGHLVIRGSQEVRVNYELRDLQITGIVRPEDITRRNIVTFDKIADARISYGGRGQLTNIQQPRIGQQIIDIVSPF